MVCLLPRKLSLFLCFLAATAAASLAVAQSTPPIRDDASKGYRFERGGWTYVHLEGNPSKWGSSTAPCWPPKLKTWSG